MIVTWKSSPWKKLFVAGGVFSDAVDVRAQDHSLSIYEGGKPIGMAEFRTFLSHCDASFDDFVDASDEVSSELYEFALGLSETISYLCGFCELRRGMRIIEFKRLAMCPEHATSSKWIAPINAFINKKFQITDEQWNLALVLCPFPLEFEVGIDDQDLDEGKLEKLSRRRKALVRHYKKTLGVELAVPETADRWWMGRLL
jgi:hypothetical protein